MAYRAYPPKHDRTSFTPFRGPWLVTFGKIRMAAKFVVLLGVVALVAYSMGRRGSAAEPLSAASTRAEAAGAVSPTDRAVLPATMGITGATTFAATATDSLRVPMDDRSNAVLAPRATLSMGPAFTNPSGVRQRIATLSGAMRVTIAENRKSLLVRAAAGSIAILQGTYDINAMADALEVHTIDGEALLYKPHGLFAWIPRKVPPGRVGRVEAGKTVGTVVAYK